MIAYGDTLTGQIPWFIDSIGASKCEHISKGRGSMVMIVDLHINPFAIANNATPLKGKVYYIDVEGKTFFDYAPSENDYPALHATAIAGLIAGDSMLLPYKFDDGYTCSLLPIPVSGVAPGSKVTYVGTRLSEATFYSLTLNSIYTFELIKNITLLDKDGKETKVFNHRQKTNIINLSVGDKSSDEAGWKEVLKIAEDENVLLVIAAGNDGVDFDTVHERRYIPQELMSKDNVILVAATDREGQLCKFSNRSARLVDIAAPGEYISVVRPDNTSDIKSGTSYAAPLVAGTLALGVACKPYIRPAKLKAMLLEEAKSYDSLQQTIKNGKFLDSKAFVEKICLSYDSFDEGETEDHDKTKEDDSTKVEL